MNSPEEKAVRAQKGQFQSNNKTHLGGKKKGGGESRKSDRSSKHGEKRPLWRSKGTTGEAQDRATSKKGKRKSEFNLHCCKQAFTKEKGRGEHNTGMQKGGVNLDPGGGITELGRAGENTLLRRPGGGSSGAGAKN